MRKILSENSETHKQNDISYFSNLPYSIEIEFKILNPLNTFHLCHITVHVSNKSIP